MSAYYYSILLHMCPHTTMTTATTLPSQANTLLYMCSHTTMCPDSTICVLILLCMSSCYYMRPHTTTAYCYTCVLTILCVRILLCMWPHTTIYVSSYERGRRSGAGICPHTTVHVSPYYYICVLTLLYMCPHTSAVAGAERANFFFPATAFCLFFLL